MSQLPSSRRATTAQNYNDRSTRAPPVIYHPTASDLNTIFDQNSDFAGPLALGGEKVKVETLNPPQTGQENLGTSSDKAGPLALGGEKVKVEPLNPPQTGQENLGTSSDKAGPLALGGEKVKVEPLNPPQTGQENLGTSSDKAGPLALGGEKVKVETLNPPQTGQENLGTSSDTPTARRGTPTLKRKRQLSILVKLQSTAQRYQEAINKNLSRSIKARKIMTEAVESIQKIPLSGRKGGFHIRKSSELLRTCKCLLDETAKTSTLQ
ncbi:uncharacterized protein LOC110366742 isoform X2 [Fundulus heteroclitus]|uniref:uncharacterized protein LOC110366742 isoform X2 n=1 Tax=Fundulus heteroclitus TaxID=8078 RepID=UPI00165ABA8C|nr:uncharacterized protein LOC110366742 isoform X2 [Fundulus heteroclitus]